MHNFSQSKYKLRYAYLLTQAGVAEKSKLISQFLKRKRQSTSYCKRKLIDCKQILHLRRI